MINMLFTVTVRVSSTSARIQVYIPSLSTLTWDITRFEMFSKRSSWYLRRSTSTRMDRMWWTALTQSKAWILHKHSWFEYARALLMSQKGKICWVSSWIRRSPPLRAMGAYGGLWWAMGDGKYTIVAEIPAKTSINRNHPMRVWCSED